MALIDDWRAVLRKAWSIKLILVAGVFSGLEALIQIATALDLIENYTWMPRGWFALLGFAASNAAFVTRLLAQKELNGNDK